VTRSSRLVAALLCAAVLVVASACSPGSGASSSAGSTTPTVDESTTGSPPAGADAPVGFSRVTLIVTRPDGIVEVHCVWLADTVELRDLGLMGITDPDMGGPGAMVFRFDRDSSLPFWMKDTILPLSIAWVDAGGSVVRTADMPVCPPDVANCPTYSAGNPYRLAVEMAQGRLSDWGLAAGSSVELGSAC
jgi:uncharacterized membrane protein (UPF0127 family)